MNDPILPYRRDRLDDLIFFGAVGILYLSLFGVGGLIAVGVRLSGWQIPRRYAMAAGVVAVLALPLVVGVNPLENPVHYWLWVSPLWAAPAYACLWGMLWFERRVMRLTSWDEWLVRLEQRHDRQTNQRVRRQLARGVADCPGIELGLWVEGEQFTSASRLSVRNGVVQADPSLFDRHIQNIVIPGSSKSEAIKRIVGEFARKSSRPIFVIDAKGELDFAVQMRDLLVSTRGVHVPLFTMGHSQPGDLYDGFAGSAEAIAQRLKAMFQVEAQQGDGEFYANVNRALLTLVCEATGSPPRSLAEFDQRLNLDWLAYAYRHDPGRRDAVERYRGWFDGARVRADSLVWEFSRYISPGGFRLDDTPAAIFSLRTSAVGDSARRFFSFLMEDFNDYIGKRQSVPSLVVMDEVGQVPAERLLALIELGRSAQLGVVLATQDLATITDFSARSRLLGSVGTKLLMQTDVPQMVGDMAGTRKHAHMTYQTDERHQPTGLGSIRLEDERKVDLNRVRRFPPGRGHLIHGGESAVIQVRPIPPEKPPE